MAENTIPTSFHVMAKPTGSRCNLDCAYCFFLKKAALYPDSAFRSLDGPRDLHVMNAQNEGQA
jgi:uncharacterized protein